MEKLFEDIDRFLDRKRSEDALLDCTSYPQAYDPIWRDVLLDSDQRLKLMQDALYQEEDLVGLGFDLGMLLDLKINVLKDKSIL